MRQNCGKFKFYPNYTRGVQHHWHTARNEAIANGGKESGTLDSVPARTVLQVQLFKKMQLQLRLRQMPTTSV